MRRQQARRLGAPLLAHFLLSIILLCSNPGAFSSKIVTLDSIELFTSHEWLDSKPIVYFYCQDGNDTTLPDVKKTNVVYIFKGAESWQPLTELYGHKCKRCGFYERDTLKSDDVFDEWELCPDDFVGSDGKYVHFKDEEFNATFSCPECKTDLVHTKSWKRNAHSFGNCGECAGFCSNCYWDRVWVQILAKDEEGTRPATVFKAV